MRTHFNTSTANPLSAAATYSTAAVWWDLHGRLDRSGRSRSTCRRRRRRVERAPLPPAVLALLRTREPAVLRAPFWQTLARRLSAADRHGQNLDQVMAAALGQGPLPEERPAAALWSGWPDSCD
ncbi:hypothetical protein GCM10022236_02350 [Microlunatus ginsengisoli]|uniref:Uncharacterized protein n=1 Tax=Microlunatus ginsengisoli TaxID=363863 RepID=A0ABP6ZBH3_9ACTN